MNAKKLVTLLLVAVLALSLAACGPENNDKMGDMGGNGSAMTGEPKNAEEALAMHKELMAQEKALLSEKTELWEKVFMAADKGMTMQEDGEKLRQLPAQDHRGRQGRVQRRGVCVAEGDRHGDQQY